MTDGKRFRGEWKRMSDLSEEEDTRYQCSHCGNVVHYKNSMDLYTFNSYCGRCGSDNSHKVWDKVFELCNKGGESNMSKERAVAIFANIQDKFWSTEEKAIAIKVVLEMATHNSITKDEMLGVIAWLLDQAFEFEDE